MAPTPYLVALLVAVVVCLPVAGVAWRRREKTGAVPLVAIVVGAAIWGIATLMVALSANFGEWLFWNRVVYVGIAVVIPAWVAFALSYTGNEEYVTPWTVGGLAVVPVATIVLAWVDSTLLWEQVVVADTASGFRVEEFGPVFAAHAAYTYAATLAGIVLLLVLLYRRGGLYQGQAAAILVAAVVPLAANVLYLGQFTPVDVTPIGFAATGVALLFALVRLELMNLTPVARSTVVDNIDDGVIVLDSDDRVVDINPVAEEILGVDEEAIGTHARDLLDRYSDLYDRYEDVDSLHEEISLETSEGIRFFAVRVSPLSDSRGRQVGRLFLFHDITDQKRRQQELERQNEQLEQFASLVSHDLRNPLNVADGFVDIAIETGDLDQYIDKIERSHDRMEQLIEDVLTLARQGKTVTDAEPTHIRRVAREAWDHVDTRDATLSVDVDRRIRADPDRLMRLFENLFRNSVEHGGADVHVRVGGMGLEEVSLLRPEEKGFFVADDGPGIPEDERDDVLEDGFTTSEDGTGLGLSIVTSVVEAHGWETEVAESESGGARFDVRGVEFIDEDVTAEAVGVDPVQ